MALFLPRLSFILIVAGRADGEHHGLRLACAKIHTVHLSQYRGKFFLTFQRRVTFRVRDPWCEYLLVCVAREGNERSRDVPLNCDQCLPTLHLLLSNAALPLHLDKHTPARSLQRRPISAVLRRVAARRMKHETLR